MKSKNICSYSIGMFDSGIGGLTVMKQLIRVLPQERVIYFGDTARLPYGEKSRETIIQYSIENAIFLLEQNIKILVVACNTASAYAIDKLRRIFNIPVVDVIEPGAKKAVQMTRKGRIAVLGTRGTIRSQAYQKEITSQMPEAVIFPIACPLFTPLVEERYLKHPAAKMIVQDYLNPLKQHDIDTILLGCTHYPLLEDLIREVVGEDILIVDSATTCAQKVVSILEESNLQVPDPSSPPVHQYFVSDDPQKFQLLGQEFLGDEILQVVSR
jgi:glutamate racemase